MIDIRYNRPPGVEVVRGERPLLATGRGGFVAIDEPLLALWEKALEAGLAGTLAGFTGEDVDIARAALACLAEAGLLARDAPGDRAATVATTGGELVSAVIPITSEKERDWLGDCIRSLQDQTYRDVEVIVVDNATDFGLPEWLRENHPAVRTRRLPGLSPFAVALNSGVAQARGAYYLLLNPDLVLEPGAVAAMVAVARGDARCAAVAAKLKFLWAPAFLNGIGNRVRDRSWGTDNGIGHLDLGQFDDWREVPSACFAAALVPRPVWDDVGPVDEGFQLYYEDAEWCYRARLLGYTVRPAPQANVLHYFGGWVREPGKTVGLTPWKLRHATYGRLRFAMKIPGPRSAIRLLAGYVKDDLTNMRAAARFRSEPHIRAGLGAWKKLLKDAASLLYERSLLQARRRLPDEALLTGEGWLPQALVWRDLPEMSWDLVASYYLPLMRSGRTRPLAELNSAR